MAMCCWDGSDIGLGLLRQEIRFKPPGPASSSKRWLRIGSMVKPGSVAACPKGMPSGRPTERSRSC